MHSPSLPPCLSVLFFFKQARRGSIPVNLGGVPEVVMGESIFNSDVRDHTESSYFEAIQVLYADDFPCLSRFLPVYLSDSARLQCVL